MEQYLEAAKVLRSVRAKKGSLRTLALSPHIKNKRFVYATVAETLKKQDVVNTILERAALKTVLAKQIRDPCMLSVLLYDLLFGKGIQGGGSIKRILKSHEQTLREAAGDLLDTKSPQEEDDEEEEGDDGKEGGAKKPAAVPIRYVRVNTLKLSVAEALERLTTSPAGGGGGTGDGKGAQYYYNRSDVELDPHVEGLLVLPGGRPMHDHPMVKDGILVLQDKASCFPAQALLGPAACYGGGDVIDACAAPGNKTAQLAASLAKIDPSGRVLAFDRDAKRLGVLTSRVVGQMGAGPVVVPLLEDFLGVDPSHDLYAKVRAILLDPSCSGSGIDSLERRVESNNNHKQNKKFTREQQEQQERKKLRQRLLSLSQFQYKALTKAFSFPQVERVVYSTCSVHPEENEMVVSAALRSEDDKAKEDPTYQPFELQPALQSWPRRGLKQGEEGQTIELTDQQVSCLVRADPREDKTTGFFVAYFERRGLQKSAVISPKKSTITPSSSGKKSITTTTAATTTTTTSRKEEEEQEKEGTSQRATGEDESER